jgi:hypothetical protein
MLFRLRRAAAKVSVYRGEIVIGDHRLSLFDEDPRSGRLWQAVGSQATANSIRPSKCTSGRCGLAGCKTAPTVVKHAGPVTLLLWPL